MTQEKPLLYAENLQKSFYYPKQLDLLKGIDLSVYPGETVAILGRSGEGKSTLLQILGTLDTATSGTLLIDNSEVNPWNVSFLRNQVAGFVFQSFHLLDDLTAFENILMPAKIARKATHKNSSAYIRANELLAKVGLTERKDTPAKWLSGGEKQRISLARAMCNDPKILFADEPSGNLDKETASVIHSLLLDFAKKEGKSLVVVTHNPSLACLCETNYRLEKGLLFPEKGENEKTTDSQKK